MNIKDIQDKFVEFAKTHDIPAFVKTQYGEDIRFADGEDIFNEADVVHGNNDKVLVTLAVFGTDDDDDEGTVRRVLIDFAEWAGLEWDTVDTFIPRDDGADFDAIVTISVK